MNDILCVYTYRRTVSEERMFDWSVNGLFTVWWRRNDRDIRSGGDPTLAAVLPPVVLESDFDTNTPVEIGWGVEEWENPAWIQTFYL